MIRKFFTSLCVVALVSGLWMLPLTAGAGLRVVPEGEAAQLVGGDCFFDVGSCKAGQGGCSASACYVGGGDMSGAPSQASGCGGTNCECSRYVDTCTGG